jgi:hypothetical protein
MLEFELDERRASRLPERTLIAAALLAWVEDILDDARRDEIDPGHWLSRFKRWTPNNMPPRWVMFCALLDLEPWTVVERVWRRIAQQRDDLTRKRLVREATAAGFSKAEAEQWAELSEADAA